MTAPDAGDTLSFARDIGPLFRAKDRDSMRFAFDLFDYTDVARHADAIVGALRSGNAPLGGGPAATRPTSRYSASGSCSFCCRSSRAAGAGGAGGCWPQPLIDRRRGRRARDEAVRPSLAKTRVNADQ